ncbi:MAG TPA: aspartate aminotransferase family protein [Burkholderiales bacterium]|nr:aspartate aminotransferase family protein [Burkholderiales bacterium]
MTHALHRHSLDAEFPVAVKGDGVYLVDANGKRYLDGSGGAAVSCLGHSNARVREAIHAQIDTLAFAHTRFFTNEPMEALARDLVADAPPGLTKAWFTCGGSESIEAALKMTRQYFVETGQPQRRNVIGRLQSYHGTTAGALSAGGNIGRRAVFEPLLLGAMHHISPCFAYRGQGDDESASQYGLRVADELEAKILELGPDTVAAFIAETVVGSTLGCVPPVPGYFKRIREICDKYGVLLILDEVMCGMGRTGYRYACEAEGVAPDFIALAKALSAGYLPLGALLVGDKVHKAIEAGSNAVMHSHTFTGHPAACAAAVAVQKEVRERDLLANVRKMGGVLKGVLSEQFGNHPHVGDIRGRGLFVALELVKDRGTKEPFDAALGLSERIRVRAMENGLICYPMGGVVDGRRGENVMLAPAFIIEEPQVFELVDKLNRTLEDVLP